LQNDRVYGGTRGKAASLEQSIRKATTTHANHSKLYASADSPPKHGDEKGDYVNAAKVISSSGKKVLIDLYTS
jgi:hypothetical protein